MFAKITNYFIHCPGCGRSWGNFYWLCPSCEVSWFAGLRLQKRAISHHIDHYYLKLWNAGDGQQAIVHSLKGGGKAESMDKLVMFFPKKTELKTSFFYPDSGRGDHAWELADAINKRHGGVIYGLKKISGGKQALRVRQKRNLVQFENFTGRVNHPLVLVDDIVTTGATAKACWRALGSPPKMSVWSLFYRAQAIK